MRRFIVREAELFEFEAVRAFYRDNAHSKVAERPKEIIEQALRDGNILVAIDTAENGRNRYIGASAAYTVVESLESGGRTTLKEAGSSLIKDTHRGFGIHKIFHWGRSLHEHILDCGGFEHYFCSIRCPNPESEGSALKTGFTEWTSPPTSLVSRKSMNLPKSEEMKFFRLPASALQVHAQRILEQELCHTVTRRNGTKEVVELTMALQILERYRSIVTEIAEKGAKTVLFE